MSGKSNPTTLRGTFLAVLRDIRHFAIPALDALHRQIEVRTPNLRVMTIDEQNVVSDFALLERASPYIHRRRRPAISITLVGHGRFDEGVRRTWLEAGDITHSNQRRAGMEAYAGTRHRMMIIDWDPARLGSGYSGSFQVGKLGTRDLQRVVAVADALAGPRPQDAVSDLLAVLRATGVPTPELDRDELAATAHEDRVAFATCGEILSQLERAPAIEDLAERLGQTSRHVNRRLRTLAERYALLWPHWRAALHQARMAHALRLLGSPRATTELIARLVGFRSPSALCHALAEAELPSPGELLRLSRHDVLAQWAAFSPMRHGADEQECRPAS